MLRIITCTKKGELNEAMIERLPELLSDKDSITWVDLHNPTDEEAGILTNIFKFHPLAVEDCLATVPNPKIDGYVEYLYVRIRPITPYQLISGEFETHDLDIF